MINLSFCSRYMWSTYIPCRNTKTNKLFSCVTIFLFGLNFLTAQECLPGSCSGLGDGGWLRDTDGQQLLPSGLRVEYLVSGGPLVLLSNQGNHVFSPRSQAESYSRGQKKNLADQFVTSLKEPCRSHTRVISGDQQQVRQALLGPPSWLVVEVLWYNVTLGDNLIDQKRFKDF